jgi:hypothetical protein
LIFSAALDTLTLFVEVCRIGHTEAQ